MSALDEIEKAIDLLVGPPEKTGSNDCGCDDCARKRMKTTADVIVCLVRARKEIERDGAR